MRSTYKDDEMHMIFIKYFDAEVKNVIGRWLFWDLHWPSTTIHPFKAWTEHLLGRHFTNMNGSRFELDP
jgi:hypothetical protein